MTLIFFGLWLFWGAFWIVNARRVKVAERRETPAQRLGHVAPLIVVGALLALPSIPMWPLDLHFAQQSYGLAIVGALLTAAGLVFSIWARVTIGGNWSGIVTVKQDHTLVVDGPYAWVRHPIYTGLLLAFLGSALAIGEVRGLLAVGIAGVAFWLKLKREEGFMIDRFGATYVEYARRVPALIPFVA